VSPFAILFAVSTILMNHQWKPQERVVATATKEAVEVREGVNNQELGQDLLRQLGISGELGGVRRLPEERRLVVNAVKPGRKTTITVELDQRVARIEHRQTGFLDASRFLHLTPGPHRVRGPHWLFTRIWSWMADATVYLVLFISMSGVYMWAVIKAERKAGLILLGGGCLTFAALAAILV